MWGKKERTGRHEPLGIPVSTHTMATAIYRLLCPGPSSAAHGIHNPPWLGALLRDELPKERIRYLYRDCTSIVKEEIVVLTSLLAW
jgi:hypothetical protein